MARLALGRPSGPRPASILAIRAGILSRAVDMLRAPGPRPASDDKIHATHSATEIAVAECSYCDVALIAAAYVALRCTVHRAEARSSFEWCSQRTSPSRTAGGCPRTMFLSCALGGDEILPRMVNFGEQRFYYPRYHLRALVIPVRIVLAVQKS